ncbi:MAG: YdeI/OmpD-associated family protein [Candidatus Promineifilaceae bacterium]
MNESDRLYVSNREAWRQWLEANYRTAAEIWLIYPRKHTGIARIPYNHAVEEALCFGWIDSITKTIDEDQYSQRFTPRKPRSRFSQTNKERLRRLIEQEKVMPDVLTTIDDVLEAEFQFPSAIESAFRANEQAWENFQRYSGPYQRIRIAYVDVARKRPEEFEKRLRHLIRMTEQDKQFGFGIEDYY